MWALVTGGARRIGKAISLRLAKAGYGIAIHAHRGIDDAEALADEIREQGGDARVFSADLTQKVEAETLVVEVLQGCGRLDALILNAANFERVPLGEIDDGH